MALPVPRTVLQNMMKEGAKHMHGLDGAVYRNIEACRQLSQITKSSFGPNGMNKMVINHLEKLFVTNDAATMLKELEVEHPAAKMIVLAANMQESEVGDGTNFVLIFSGALLNLAEELLRMGLSPAEVIEGYELAMTKALDILPGIVCTSAKELTNPDLASKYIKTSLASKQYGNQDFLANLIAKACVSVNPKQGLFNVDNVRVAKILGSGIHASDLVKGMVFQREVEGNVNKVSDCRIAAFSCPLDIDTTETKGTVLIKSSEELLNFSKGEEDRLEGHIKAIAEAGCNVIVTGGKAADMALHFANKYNIMVVRLTSKFDLRRLCRSVRATALPKITVPTKEEIGHCDKAYASEIGEKSVIIFEQVMDESAVSTLVLRGSTSNVMDDIERSVDDGVNCYKALTRDARLLPGAGATEIELAHKLKEYGRTLPNLEQYAVHKFAEALEVVPRTLATNAGVKPTELVSNLYAAHNSGNRNVGFDVEGDGAATLDAHEAEIWDSFLVKHWGLKFAANAAITVLKVDQIIMAKRAGGPKPKENKNWDED